MSSTNLKSAPRGERLHADLAVAELAVAAGLLLVAAVALGRALDRLAVRDLRLLEVDLDLVALAQAAHHHLDVQLAHAREQHLVGLRVARDAQHRVLLEQPVQRGRDLVVVAARLGLDREGGGRLREDDLRIDDRVRLVRERVARLRLLELRHRADVARLDLGHRRLRLALQQQQRADALGHVARRVVDRGVGLERARVHAEQADAPGVRVDERLPDERGERRVGRRLARRPACSRRPAPPPRRGRRARARGRRSRRASGARRRCSSDEAGSTGKILPAPTARAAGPSRAAPARACPSRRTPPSAPRCSPRPSRRASRARPSRVSCCAAGISPVWNLPLASSA